VEPLASPLPALGRLLSRLAGLPPDLGEIRLDALRDTSCLRHLDAAVGRPEALRDLVERANRSPELTLAALGAAEILHQSDPAHPDDAAEFGRLQVATGEVGPGLAFLARAAATHGPASRAAWYRIYSLRHAADLAERRRHLDAVTQADQAGYPDALRHALQLEAWWLALVANDQQRAAGVRYELERFLHEPLAAPATRDQHALRARGLHCLGYALSRQTSSRLLETAAAHLREATARYRDAADPAGLARGLDTLGRVLTRLGHHDEALAVFVEELELRQQLRDLWGVGATINGLALLRLTQGQPLLSADLLQANLVLLPMLDAPATLRKHNQGQLVVALLTAAFPIEESAVNVLPRLTAACLEFAAPPCDGNDEALAWFFNAARRWLEARQVPDPGARRERLLPAIRLLRDSLARYKPSPTQDERPRIALYLALALLDRAAVAAGPDGGQKYLDQAHGLLEQADGWLQDLLLRPYLEWGFAQWATAARRFEDRQAHLASARHYAESTGNVLLQGLVDDSLNANLSSPLRTCPSPLVLVPGQALEVPVRVSDWRQRPLSRFALRVRASGDGRCRVVTEQLRTNESGQARVVLQADGEGSGEVEIRTLAGRPLATVAVQARDLAIDGWDGSAEDAFVLRQLFGAGYSRLLVRRAFEGGLSGMQVLLVHPQMRPPTGSAGVWNGQPCIVKLGAVEPLTSEWERYQRWVRDLLPANVTRVTRFVAWEQRAGLLMSLVGTGWSRSRSEHDWLLDASPFDAHYLLEQIFHRDLGLAWYTNTGGDHAAAPLLEPYAWAVPPVWAIDDTHPPGGLLADPPHAAVRRLDLLTGLHPGVPPDVAEVAIDDLALVEMRPVGTGWEYQLAAASGLRVAFRSPLRLDPGERPERRWSIRGRPAETLVARLRRHLRACCAVWREAHPDAAGPEYDPAAGRLRLPVDGAVEVLPDPLAVVGRMFQRRSPWYGSVIHGDLHGRNVLVDAHGQPYYIDFAKTRVGPTLFDFIKHEQYLWHDLFARQVDADLGALFAWMFPLLERLRDASHHLHRPGGDGGVGFPDWLPGFEQGLQTLRVLGRAYTRGPDGVDFHAPFAALAALMLRWCPAGEAPAGERLTLARQGLIQAALAAWTVRHALG